MPGVLPLHLDLSRRHAHGRDHARRHCGLLQVVLDGIAYITASRGNPDPKILGTTYANMLKTGAYSTQEVFDALELPLKCQDILSTYWSYLGVDMEHLAFIHYAAMVHKYVSLRLPEREATEYYYECARKKQTARERILKELLDNPGDRIPYELITSKLNVTSATLKSLSDKGIIRIDSEEYFRNPVAAETTRYGQKVLSDEQQNIVDSVVRDYDEGKRETYLIHGITGSGKII